MKAALFVWGLLNLPLVAQADNEAVLDAMQDFMEFADYSEGAITPEQMKSVGLAEFTIVDTRLQSHYEAEHIDDAINIEWRQIIARRDELPRNRPVVLYCDTGLLSSKAHLALLLAGHDNVKVLSGGFNGWKLEQVPGEAH